MRHVIVSIVSVVAVVLLAIGGFSAAFSPTQARPSVECTAAPIGNSMNITLTCIDLSTGATLGPNDVDLSVNGLNITVKAPTKTIRPKPIRVTKTVRPKPTRVTVTSPPQVVVRTKTVRPNPVRVTVTPRPVILTKTVNAQPRQDGTDRGMMEPEPRFFSKDIDFGDDNLTAAETGLGALSILFLALVGLLAVYGGYLMGRESREDEDTDFMRRILEIAKLNR